MNVQLTRLGRRTRGEAGGGRFPPLQPRPHRFGGSGLHRLPAGQAAYGNPWRLWLLIGLFGIAAYMVFALKPAWLSRLLPPCPIRALTGLQCPGCGATRALHELLLGHVAAAFRFNALVVAALPLLITSALWRRWSGRWPALLQQWWLKWFLLTLVVAFGIIRNVLSYPVALFGQ